MNSLIYFKNKHDVKCAFGATLSGFLFSLFVWFYFIRLGFNGIDYNENMLNPNILIPAVLFLASTMVAVFNLIEILKNIRIRKS